MSLRGIAVLLLILAVLVLALVRLKGPKEEAAQVAADSPVLAEFAEGAVRSIRTTCPDTSFEIRREAPGRFRLTAPYAADADPREVRTLVEALRGARVRKLIAPSAPDAAAFGLGAEACSVRLELDSDAAGRTLTIGRSSPVGYERYARAGDGRIVFVEGSLFTAVARPADAFEERRLLPLDPSAVSRLEIERPQGKVVLVRAGDVWRLEAPVADLADPGEAEHAVRAATSVQLERGSKAPVPATSAPERRIAIRAGGVTAYVATAGVGGRRLAWRENGSWAGLVADPDLADLDRPATAFRDRQVVNFSSPDAGSVVVTRGSSVLTLVRSADQMSWTAREGAEAAASVDASRVAALLDRLRSVRASEVLEGSPPSPPTGTIAVTGAAGELARASWGPLPPRGGEESVWVSTPARAGVVFRVPAASFGPIPLKRADLAAVGP